MANPSVEQQSATAPPEKTAADSHPYSVYAVLAWAFSAFFLDQLSKIAVRHSLEIGFQYSVINGWLYFTHAQNTGAAWSILSGQRFILIIATLVVIGVLLKAARELMLFGAFAQAGLGLVLGGAVGNLIDRIIAGHVTDFIDIGSPWQWLATFPIFNVADICLSVGGVLLAWAFLFYAPKVGSRN